MDVNPNDLNYSSNKHKITGNSKQATITKNHAVNLNHFNNNLNLNIPSNKQESKKPILFSIKKDLTHDIKLKPQNFRTSKNSRI